MIKSRYLLLILLACSPPATADTLMLDVIKAAPPNSGSGLLRPKIGLTQRQVMAKFGEPVSKDPAIGYPPISTWHYDEFSVYFEFEYVITSVVHRE